MKTQREFNWLPCLWLILNYQEYQEEEFSSSGSAPLCNRSTTKKPRLNRPRWLRYDTSNESQRIQHGSCPWHGCDCFVAEQNYDDLKKVEEHGGNMFSNFTAQIPLVFSQKRYKHVYTNAIKSQLTRNPNTPWVTIVIVSFRLCCPCYARAVLVVLPSEPKVLGSATQSNVWKADQLIHSWKASGQPSS